MAVSPAYTDITLANTFNDWRIRTNQLSTDLSTIALTVDGTNAGASVIGNSTLKGNFDCFILSVGTGIRGGTNLVGAPLNVTSALNVQGNLAVTGTSAVSGAASFASTLAVAGAASFDGPSLTTLATTTTTLAGPVNIDGSLTVSKPALFTNTVTATQFIGPATSAATLETPRNITLTGAVTGTTTVGFDGSADVSITTSFTGGGIIPTGGIIMWSGATVPVGWLLCDGANGTPDLRDRFIVGSGSTYATGATGGAATVALTSQQIPAHTHTVTGTTSSDGAHTHTGTVGLTFGGAHPTGFEEGRGSPDWAVGAMGSAGAHTHTVTGTAAATGGGLGHENRPPYYALAFIMKV